MSSLYNFALEYERGVNDGRKEILNDIVNILNNSEYPEDVEMVICDYLESKGVKLYDN